jgi:ATP-binding cassette, subfamily B, bacterial PglK
LIKTITQLFHLFLLMDKNYIKKLILIASLSSLMMLLELASLGSLYTFINSVFDANTLNLTQKIINNALNFDLNERNTFYSLSFFLCFFISLSTISKIIILNFQLKFAQKTGVVLSSFILNKIFHNKFLKIRTTDSNELIALVTTKTNRIVNQALNPLLQMISAALIISSVIAFLIIIKPVATILIFMTLTVFFYTITKITRPRLHFASRVMNANLTKSIEIAKNTVSNIRAIILEDKFLEVKDNFYSNEHAYRNQQRLVQLYALVPKHILEMSLILLAVLYLSASQDPQGGMRADLGFMAVLVYAAQRSLPLFQQIYAGFTQIQSNQHIIQDMITYIQNSDHVHYGSTALTFSHSIKFQKVGVQLSARFKMNDLNQAIQKGDVIGIVGPTGHGKSTFIDMLCGLITPETGQILVDDVPLFENNMKSWQKKISLVPQVPYFENRKLGENFFRKGVPSKIEHIRESLLLAGLSSTFDIERDFNMDIGENGSLLSGGQRQRLAIARAIHTNADLIILDESTSALDSLTEKQVLTNIITNKKPNVTIILITHNQENLKYCNRALKIKDGNIVEFAV